MIKGLKGLAKNNWKFNESCFYNSIINNFVIIKCF